MAGKSKTVQPEYVLRQTLTDGIEEMRRAGVVVRVGNTDKHGGGLVLSIPAWRYCACCDEVVTVPEYDQSMSRCRECAAADVPVLAQREDGQ